MADLPQRDLRNNVSAVLRAAEAGAEYTVTVGGRPVARLGPFRARQWVVREDVTTLLATPSDPSLLDDLVTDDMDDGLDHDPWATG